VKLPGVDVDQRDLPPAWHLKAVLATVAVLGLVYVVATRILL
jgi:hypothetical protein